jgi:Planctomycete cytochrome C/Cytochrome C oxidase, cbb3-type, subunit III
MYKIAAAFFIIIVLLVVACKHEPVLVNGAPPDVTPPATGANTICFQSNVLPVFVSNCAKSGCHDAVTKKEGIQLDNYTDIMKGIKPNDPSGSKYWRVMIDNDPKDRMPPPPASSLTTAQKDSVYKWIVQGAQNTTNCANICDPFQFSYGTTVRAIIANNCAGCHGAVSPSAGLNLTDFNTVKIIGLNGRLLGAIKQQPPFRPMPPVGKLPDCNIDQIVNWVNAGAPNN